jgi:hypothetical protein
MSPVEVISGIRSDGHGRLRRVADRLDAILRLAPPLAGTAAHTFAISPPA